jgi:NhaP-type Na+/H+ or K+/H+ antiporter
VVLATFPLIAGVQNAGRFFDIAFFTVVISTIVQGMTFEPLARRLGLTKHPSAGRDERTRVGGPIPPLVTQLWSAPREDPADPLRVAGVDVTELLCTRADVAGALVVLADGRLAVTGPSMTVGSPRQIERYARRRLDVVAGSAEAGWWVLVIAALERATAVPESG